MDRLLAGIRAVLASSALAWAVLIVAAPSLGSSAHAVPVHVAAGTYLVGAAVCHQLPNRSFHAAGMRLPVCARCTGLYLSGALGVMAGLAWVGARRRRARPIGGDWRTWIVLAAVPTAATLGMEWIGLWSVPNAARAIAAAPLGLAAGALVAAGLSFRSRL